MSEVASPPARPEHQHAWTFASLIVGSAFLGLWFWLFPRWLGFRVDLSGVNSLRLLAVIPSILGFSVALTCIWDFGRTGRGTPAPMLPPQRLVVVGYYRYVRNPMYCGFFVGWIGLWIIFGHVSTPVLIGAAAVVLAVHLFVTLYEERTLRERFGEDYQIYCRNVRRWIPRLRPWIPR